MANPVQPQRMWEKILEHDRKLRQVQDPVQALAATPGVVVVGITDAGEGASSSTLQAFLDKFTGNGTTTAFTLTNVPILNAVWVFLDRTPQIEGVDYTVNYATGVITFTSAPATGTQPWARYLSFGVQAVRVTASLQRTVVQDAQTVNGVPILVANTPNRLLVVAAICYSQSIANVISFNGTPMTELIRLNGDDGVNVSRTLVAAYMVNPPANDSVDGTITATFTGSTGNAAVIYGAVYSGVDQSAPLGTPVGGASAAGAIATSVALDASGPSGQPVLSAAVGRGTNPLVVSAAQSILQHSESPSGLPTGMSSQAAGTETTWAWDTAGNYAAMAVAIRGAVA